MNRSPKDTAAIIAYFLLFEPKQVLQLETLGVATGLIPENRDHLKIVANRHAITVRTIKRRVKKWRKKLDL